MRKQFLRKTTLLSLLGLKTSASAQSAPSSATASIPPATPSTSLALLASFSPSTDTLVPPEASTKALPTGDFTFTVSLASPTADGTLLLASPPKPYTSSSVTESRRTSSSNAEATASNTADVFTGQAGPRAYVKLGLAGAMAGAAGVFLV